MALNDFIAALQDFKPSQSFKVITGDVNMSMQVMQCLVDVGAQCHNFLFAQNNCNLQLLGKLIVDFFLLCIFEENTDVYYLVYVFIFCLCFWV